MSHGISQQQRRMLGLAVTISRLNHGEPVGHATVAHERYTVPIVITEAHADLNTQIVAHVLHGVAMHPLYGYGEVCLDTTPAALSARASISRALGSLRRRGLLAPHVDPQHLRFRNYGDIADARAAGEAVRSYLRSGYCLTIAGLAVGQHYELSPIPDLDRRIWLLEAERKWSSDAPHERLRDTLRSPRLRT